jgi:hypothetical protein
MSRDSGEGDSGRSETRISLAHIIEEQRLELRVHGLPASEGPRALEEKLSALNRQRLLPLIERLLDEFDRAGEVLRLEELDVDLGSFARFDPDEIAARLEARLREALDLALQRSVGRRGAGIPSAHLDPPTGAAEESVVCLVGNAGLILAGPFLPQLFERLDLLAGNAAGTLAWREPEAAGRAVHLLQYLVDGRCDTPEPLLALNKVLCGVEPGVPVVALIEIGDEERRACESLLEAMLAHWPPLRGSSKEALQVTFLQRQGRLSRSATGWRLEVERKALDVLLDTVGWSYSMIRHSWMADPVAVVW